MGSRLLGGLPPRFGAASLEAGWRSAGRLFGPGAPLGRVPVWPGLATRCELLGSHLQRVCGPGLRAGVLDELVAEALASYGRYWAESLRLGGVPAGELLADLEVTGLEHLDEALGLGRGAILVLPHLGGWDWGGGYLAARGYRVSVVVEALRPPEVQEWFAGLRGGLGLEVIAAGPGAARSCLGALGDNRVLCLLADRVVPGVAGVEVGLFGSPALLPAGPATLALRTGAPAMAAAVYFRRGRPGHHAVLGATLPMARSGRFGDDVLAGTRLVAGALEGLIRAAPTQWHALHPVWTDELDG
ncbi:MAG: phosphatidylinositol mannoside acyltransferase [Actinomycetota bacterium]|nr:phosphatidylinositol mannoside acyltransferase [Actinomycetota bacterium]